MEYLNIWIILGVGSIILLFVYWGRRNAVWGGFTLGIIVGTLWKIFSGTDWYIIFKVAVVGSLIGFGAELLGLAGDYLKNKRMKNDPLGQLTDPNNEFVKALKWLEGDAVLQKEFDEILKKYGEFDDQNRAQEWLLQKYRNKS